MQQFKYFFQVVEAMLERYLKESPTLFRKDCYNLKREGDVKILVLRSFRILQYRKCGRDVLRILGDYILSLASEAFV